MRKLFLLVLVIFLCSGAFSQGITLSFVGQLDNSEYCPMDSVVVTNVTRNWTESVVYPDTIIVVGGTVGNNLNIVLAEGLEQNVPNPFDCETRVELAVLKREDVRMQLLDVAGHVCAEYAGSLNEGVHVFDISAANPQTYILNAILGSRSYSIRMVNVGSGCGCSIKYAGIGNDVVRKFETANEFELGDDMRYVGYTTIDGDLVASPVVERSLTESQCVTLSFSRNYRPRVQTLSASGVTNLSATLRGRLIDVGGTAIIAHGFCYGTSEDNLSNNVTLSEFDDFSFVLTGLAHATTYYYRAYVTNSNGTSYGNVMSFSSNTIFMTDGVVADINCGETFYFYDSGGPDDGFGVHENMTATFISDGRLTLSFSYYEMLDDIWNFNMSVYDGDASGTALLSRVSGGDIPPSVTACSGIMTIVWHSDGLDCWGWSATISSNCNEATPPDVVTMAVDSVGFACADFRGEVTFDGHSSVSDRGFVYGINPDSLTNTLTAGKGAGSFSVRKTTLNPTTVYYYRAYATNCAGTSFGELMSFTTAEYTFYGTPGDQFTDTRDGNVYRTVTIGSQTWMAENLRYVGDFPLVSEVGTFSTSPYYCYPDNNAENVAVYGCLYNWYAQMNGDSISSSSPSDVQGICPDGWHMPSRSEWRELADNLGGTSYAGSALAGNAELWGNEYIANSPYFGLSRFDALPAGAYSTSRYFYVGFGAVAIFGATDGPGVAIIEISNGLSMGVSGAVKATSVRCVRDN